VELVELLPGQAESPIRLFLSLVLNINVHTEGHRDSKNKEFCLVLPIGQFKGGALVLYEQRLVVELRSGNFVFFRSSKSTHFNLSYEGQMASMVFHTDEGFD
jgi:hypothetical protein